MAVDELTVLLVEDNPGDARLVEHHFEKQSLANVAGSVTLDHAETLQSALDRIERESYDLILLDLGLPGTTGLETLEAATDVVERAAIVVLTGLDDTETAVEAIQRGAQDYLPKDDLDTEMLFRSVRYAIERNEQERELRRQTDQLEFFNSVLRHDVQNGMEVIRRNAQRLERDLAGADAERAETIIDWSDDIIALTGKVEGMLRTATDDVALEAISLQPLIDEQMTVVEGMGDSVDIRTDVPFGATVMADDMLADVLRNILTNAVEHNDAERTEIAVDVTTTGEEVSIEIADNGPGISESERERILRRSDRGSASDGSGFGLYFVAVMVDVYEGMIEISEKEPRGTVFTLTLPAA